MANVKLKARKTAKSGGLSEVQNRKLQVQQNLRFTLALGIVTNNTHPRKQIFDGKLSMQIYKKVLIDLNKAA